MLEPQPLSGSERRVLAHIALLGIGTTRSIARTCFGGDHGQARLTLTRLIARQAVYRHRLDFTMPSAYFSPSRHPLRGQELSSRLALLQFGYCLRQPRPYLDAVAFDALLGDVARKAGFATPAWRPCYVVRRGCNASLSLALAGRSEHLQRSLVHLDHFVDASEFAPYRLFIQAGRFLLTFLQPGPDAATAELGRWIRRRPLTARGATTLEVPVMVCTTRVPATA